MKKKENPKIIGNVEEDAYNGLTETFFLTFIGELVEIAGSFFHGNEEHNIKIAGFVLDVDDEYYYLGDTPEEINQAIRRDRVIYIQILEQVDPVLEILQDLEVPKDEIGKN